MMCCTYPGNYGMNAQCRQCCGPGEYVLCVDRLHGRQVCQRAGAYLRQLMAFTALISSAAAFWPSP